MNEFHQINTEKLVNKLKAIIKESNLDPESLFNLHALSDRTKQKMTLAEFENMFKTILPKLIKREIYYLKQHFDRGRKGSVTSQDWLHVMSTEFVEQKTYNICIEDIIKPLATKARKFNVNLVELFDRYDKDRNGRLSAEELRDGLNAAKIKVCDEDLTLIKDYFRAKTRSEAIGRNDFI